MLVHLIFLIVMFVIPFVVNWIGLRLSLIYAPYGSPIVSQAASRFQWIFAGVGLILLFSYWTQSDLVRLAAYILVGVGLVAVAILAGKRLWLFSTWCSLNPPLSAFGLTGYILGLVGLFDTLALSAQNHQSLNVIIRNLVILVAALAILLMGMRTVRNPYTAMWFICNLLAGGFAGFFAFLAAESLHVVTADQFYVALVTGGVFNIYSIKHHLGELYSSASRS